VQCSANHASWHGVAVSYMSTFLETRDWELVTCHHSDSEWYGEGSVGSVTAGGFLIFLLLVFFFFFFFNPWLSLVYTAIFMIYHFMFSNIS
jgi:hypothetical protein